MLQNKVTDFMRQDLCLLNRLLYNKLDTLGAIKMQHYYINDYKVSFDPIKHQYWVDDNPIISVTQLIDTLWPRPFKNVDPEILKQAAEKGTALRDMIEHYESDGQKTFHPEMQGYLALKSQHQINVLENEKIVLLHHHGVVVAAGSFDMVIESPYIKGQGIVDVKRMAHLDEKRLSLQLNLYKLGYEQTYKKRIDYLKCIHIRNRYYRYIDVPLHPLEAKDTLKQYLEKYPLEYSRYI